MINIRYENQDTCKQKPIRYDAHTVMKPIRYSVNIEAENEMSFSTVSFPFNKEKQVFSWKI